jgi:hypothetical protein
MRSLIPSFSATALYLTVGLLCAHCGPANTTLPTTSAATSATQVANTNHAQATLTAQAAAYSAAGKWEDASKIVFEFYQPQSGQMYGLVAGYSMAFYLTQSSSNPDQWNGNLVRNVSGCTTVLSVTLTMTLGTATGSDAPPVKSISWTDNNSDGKCDLAKDYTATITLTPAS